MTVKDLYDQVVSGHIYSDIDLQRAIVYPVEKQELVIDSIIEDIPLPAFYLWQNDDGILEVLDGKQRIESIKKFCQGNLAYKGKVWKEYAYVQGWQQKFNQTELRTIICSGDEKKKREIFRRINTLGVPLSTFEVLNGLFYGEYIEGLNDYFSHDISVRKVLPNEGIDRGKNKYTLLCYIYYLHHKCTFPKLTALHDFLQEQKDKSFNDDMKLIKPYIGFMRDVFHEKSKISTLLKFKLSVKYKKDRTIWLSHKDEIWQECNAFIKSDGYKLSDSKDDDIEAMILGIVGNLRVDPKRLFTADDKEQLLAARTANANGLFECEQCHQHFHTDELTVDHITPWSKGGRTVLSNARLLCRPCNSQLGNRNNNHS